MSGVWLVVFIWGHPIINEVMSNPLGPESGSGSPGDRNEYVEIFNPADTSIDLSGYFIADRVEKDSLIPFPDSSILSIYPELIIGTRLQPGGYALILDPEYTDPCTLYTHPYDISSGTVVLSVYDSDIGNGLSSADFLFLIAPTGDTLDFDTSALSPPDGISRERRDPEYPGVPSNWRLSRWGLTPGSINSWSLLVDLAVDADLSFYTPSFPSVGDTIFFNLSVLNFGLESIQGFSIVYSYCDIVDTFFCNETLLRDDTLSINFTLKTLLEGYEEIEIRLSHPDDADTSNNKMVTSILVGKSPIVINEIMYNDSVEWIEIYNRSGILHDLTGWKVMDKAGAESEKIKDISIESDSYLILTGDSAFSTTFPGIHFIFLPSFPTLNNTDEEIILLDFYGTVIDKVPYKKSWGGGKGRSLERISPELPSQIQSSWGTCIDEAGATPGRKNSIYTKPGESSGILNLSNRILTPNNDGINERILITFSIPVERAYVNILIFDAIGRVVRRLFQDQTDSGKGQVIWDGKSDSGRLLPTGLYIIYLEAKSKKKNYKAKKIVALKR